MRPTDFFANGFVDVIPVTPPGAKLAPSSKLAAASLGKVPGRRLDNGLWVGLNWRNYLATAETVAEWERHGANTGLRADNWPALDIDCTDEALANIIESFAFAKLGPAPVRIGRAPKRLLAYKTNHPFGRMRMWIKKGGDTHLVELLGSGNQYVVAGTHPKTLLPYSWSREFSAADLCEINRAETVEFFADLKAALEMIHGLDVQIEGDGRLLERAAATDQNELHAPSLEELRACVAATPNDFATRDEYVKYGYAIRAACGPDDEDGFEIFAGWADKWTGGSNDGDVVRTDWQRFKPPYSVGWNWLVQLGMAHGFVPDGIEVVLDGPPVPDDETIMAPTRSDQDLADIVVSECAKDMRYVAEQGKFLVWDGVKWEPDAELLAEDTVKKALRRVSDRLLKAGATTEQKKANAQEAKAICSAGKAAAVLGLVKSERAITLGVKALDTDPWLLATPNAYVDLRTGVLTAPDPDALCSKTTLVSPAVGPMPVYERFLDEVTGSDAELKRYLQKLAGYCLTGKTTEQCVTFLYGPGGNGKGVLLTAWLNIFGDYATQSAMTTFTASTQERHSTDIAGLMGARLVISSETQAGQRWDEAKVKSLSGGDKISARFMRMDNVVFTPQFKLVFAGNHRPEVRDLDDALRRRLHLVPFRFKPAAIDRALPDKLVDEYPQILNWMVEGALLWQAEGLTPLPKSIQAENESYFADNSPVSRWLNECTEHVIGESASAMQLYGSWREWAGSEGEFVGSSRRLSGLLAAAGVQKIRKAGGTFYQDVKLTEGRFVEL